MNSNIIESISNSVQQQEVKAAMQEIVDMAKELHKMIEVIVDNQGQNYPISINPRYITTISARENGKAIIELSDGRMIRVMESREEITKRINGVTKSYIK